MNSSAIGYVDFRDDNKTTLLLWHEKEISGYLVVGNTPKEIISGITEISGRMRILPDWILEGVVVGLQGGQTTVENNYSMLK
jgi:alpha-glucosidase